VAVAKRDGVILSFSLKARGKSDVAKIERSLRPGYKGLHADQSVTALLGRLSPRPHSSMSDFKSEARDPVDLRPRGQEFPQCVAAR
jgi:hypothetical protein